ncbi:zinc chelation protein SecC [Bacillus sp. UMB0899]|nr:zinc chelation protein SecC [Bacillus sp. UMB0899]
MSYERIIDQYITTNDHFLQEFIAQTLHDYPNKKNEWTRFLLREAIQNPEKATILLYLKVEPEDVEAAMMIKEGLDRVHNSIRHFFTQLLLDFTPDSILENQHLLTDLINDQDWDIYQVLSEGSEDEVWKEYKKILTRLESESDFNMNVYLLAKKIAFTLVKKNYITRDQVMMMFEANRNEEWFQYDGYLAVYMMGLMEMKETTAQLVSLLTRDDDMLLEEISEALISFQTDEVVDAVKVYLNDMEANIFATSIIENIKTEHAVNELRNAYHQVEADMQGTIFEALVHQLSPSAEPEIQDYLNHVGSSNFIDINLLAYSYFKLLGIDHPRLGIWRDNLDKR